MPTRNPTDLCLLCKTQPATKKGSHYTPANIIKKVIGDRDYEELYSISSFEHKVDQFMGRSNLKNTDPAVKKGDHVDDYIFCPECEKRLGIIEGLCGNKLNLLIENLAKGQLKILKTKHFNKYAPLSQINRNIIQLYFYSIVWRQCLQQEINSGTIIISEAFQESLRALIHQEIYKDIKAIENSANFNNYPGLEIITTYHKGDTTVNAINPNPHVSNPYLFFVGPFDVLIYTDGKTSNNFERATALPLSVIDKELTIPTSTDINVGIINENVWKKKLLALMTYQAKQHNRHAYIELAKAKSIPVDLAAALISAEASRLATYHPDNASKCINIALETLMKKL